MLEKLTKEQEVLIPLIRNKWLNYFFSLKFDEEKVRELINWIYTDFLKYKKPMIFILDSPFACQIAINLLEYQVSEKVSKQISEKVREKVNNQISKQFREQVRNKIGAQVSEKVSEKVRNQVWEQIRHQVRNKIGTQIRKQVCEQVMIQISKQFSEKVNNQISKQVSEKVSEKVGKQVRDQVNKQVRNQVRKQVSEKVSEQVWEQVREQVNKQVRNQVRKSGSKSGIKSGIKSVNKSVINYCINQVREQVWNQVREQVKKRKLKYFSYCYYGNIYDYYWCSYYDYFKQIGVISHKKFEKYIDLIKSNLFYVLTFKNVVFISRMPVFIRRNENHRLHCREEKAIEFNDGWGLFYLNGIHFTEVEFEKFIKNEPRSKEILLINNQEKRAEVIKHWGFEKIFESLRMKCISQHKEKEDIHYLFSCEDLPINLLKVIDTSTKKPYILGVPINLNDCLEAIAWTFDLSKEEYKERVES